MFGYLYFTGLAEGERVVANLDGGGELLNQSKIWAEGSYEGFAPIVDALGDR